MPELLDKPTPDALKQVAVWLGMEEELGRVRSMALSARNGARLQLAFWVGRVPSRRLRHAIYRRMGLRGARACMYRGLELREARKVTIGEGAVVAAGAVVTADVAPHAIVAGVRARVVGERSPRDLNYDLTQASAPWFV